MINIYKYRLSASRVGMFLYIVDLPHHALGERVHTCSLSSKPTVAARRATACLRCGHQNTLADPAGP